MGKVVWVTGMEDMGLDYTTWHRLTYTYESECPMDTAHWCLQYHSNQTDEAGIDGVNRQVVILSSAMPSAVINFIVSHKYQLNSDLVASVIATSTLLSVVTTPIVLFYIM